MMGMMGLSSNRSVPDGALMGITSSGLAAPIFGGPTIMLTPLLELPKLAALPKLAELPKLAGLPEPPEDNPDAVTMVVRSPPFLVLHFFSV